MSKIKKPVTYAFIDSQNLYFGVKSQGWKVDYRRLRLYLKNRYNVQKAFMFIGYIAENVGLYASLIAAGFELVYKPTVAYRELGQTTHKGNVDAELVLWAAAKTIRQYDQAIIISADGDFRCLYEYLEEKGKLKLVISPSQRFSHLLSPFKAKIVKINKLKSVLEYKNPHKKSNQPKRSVETLGRAGQNIVHQRSVETLGLSRHGDKAIVSKSGAKVKSASKRGAKK